MQRCAQAEMRMQRCTTCLASAATSATMRKAMVAAATALQRKPYHKATVTNPHSPLLCHQFQFGNDGLPQAPLSK